MSAECESFSSHHADVLRAAHADAPRGAQGEIEPRADAIRRPVRPAVIDHHRYRTSIVGVGGAVRLVPIAQLLAAAVLPLASNRGRSPCVRRSNNSSPIFLAAGAAAGRLHVFMYAAPSRSMRRIESERCQRSSYECISDHAGSPRTSILMPSRHHACGSIVAGLVNAEQLDLVRFDLNISLYRGAA